VTVTLANETVTVTGCGAMMAGCKTDDPGKGVSSAKALTSITVAGQTPDKIPAPITPAQWDDADVYLANLPENVGTVTLANTAAFKGAVIAAKVSSGATAKYAHGFDVSRSSLQFTSVTSRDFEANQYLFIQITAKDKSVQYYAFRISTVSSNATLDTVTVAGLSASKGNPAATWNGSGIAAGSVSISNQDKADAPVVATAEAQGATIKLAKVTGAGEPTFGSATSFTFADGDFLYIEVTAADGVTKQVYKVEIWIGRNADLASITFDDEDVTSLGTGNADIAQPLPGTILFRTAQASSGYEIAITPEDPDATIKYYVATEDEAVTASSFTSTYNDAAKPTLTFTDSGFLYVEVTAQNGTTKKYYKIRVNFRQTARIAAGSPDVTNKDDSEWDNAIGEYPIKKILEVVDSTATYVEQGKAHPRYTYGTAKLLWDYEGLYARVEVIDPQVTTNAATTGFHEADSFELFVNEREGVTGSGSAYVTNNLSYGQYRLGANGERSGDPAPVVTAFNTLNRTHAEKTTDGYIVIIQVPWKDPTNFTPADGAEFALELQINACTSTATRDGVMVWNNVAHSNYQNSTDYGLGILEGTPKTNAQQPVISKQPAGIFIEPNQALTLTVEAAVTDGGVLSYEWFEADDAIGAGVSKGTGTDITGGSSYAPDTSAEAVKFYYVEITNTNSSVDGKTTVTATSARARVEIAIYDAPATWEERIISKGRTLPIYGFDLGTNKLGDFTKVVFQFKIDPASPKVTGTSKRVYGPVDVAPSIANGNISVENAAPAATGTGPVRLGYQDANSLNEDYDDWDEMVITLQEFNALAATADLKQITDTTVGLGVGVFMNNADDSVVYYLKDIYLSNDAGDIQIPAVYPEHPKMFVSQGTNKYTTFYGDSGLVRDLYNNGKVALSTFTGSLGAATNGGATKYSPYEGKEWWVMALSSPGTPPAVAPFDADQTTYDAILAKAATYARVSYLLTDIDPNFKDNYSKITVTYDLIQVGGASRNMLIRNGDGGGGDPTVETPNFELGSNKTYTANTSSFTNRIAILKNNSGDAALLLLRITKISLHD